jgi:dienelactone hydrolase
MMPRSWMATVLLIGGAQMAGAQSARESGAFVMRIAGDTVVVERFTRMGDTLTGSISVKGQPHVDYTATLTADLSIRTLAIDVAATASPARHVRITMEHDSAIVSTGGTPQRIATAHGAVALLNNSFALAELFTQRARRAGGAADIPAWSVNGGASVTLSIRPVGADSMTLSIGSMTERLAVDASGRILGGTIPVQGIAISRVGERAAAALGSPAAAPPAPVATLPPGLTERAMVVPGPVPLPGTLTIPAGRGPFPGVVLVHGSGDGDRDETMPAPFAPSKPFEDIAWGLAAKGIVVLRYDKRARVDPAWYIGKNFTVYDESIQDALSALNVLRGEPEVDRRRVFQLGHSLGGMLAPRIAAADAHLAGIIIMAGATRMQLVDQMDRQGAYAVAIAGPDSGKVRAQRQAAAPIYARIRALREADTSDNTPIPGLGGTGTRYWLDLSHYDPAATMRTLRTPALVLQGMRDFQVAPVQVDDWVRAVGPGHAITVDRYPALNHLFIAGTGTPSPADYMTIGHVDPKVISDIAAWIAAH